MSALSKMCNHEPIGSVNAHRLIHRVGALKWTASTVLYPKYAGKFLA